MNGKRNYGQSVIWFAAFVAGAFTGTILSSSENPTAQAVLPVLVFFGLPPLVSALRGRVLRGIALAMLGFGTIAGPLVFVLFSDIGIRDVTTFGLGSGICILLWFVLLPFIWVEHAKTRKRGEPLVDIEGSYRIIFVLVAVFELFPVTALVLVSI